MLILAHSACKHGVFPLQPVLSLLGLVSVGMAVGVSFGLCSAFSIPYGPVHSILPLLMLGLGVDDMFVIVQCWHNLDMAVSSEATTCHICPLCGPLYYIRLP